METEVQLTVEQYDKDIAKSREAGRQEALKEVGEWIERNRFVPSPEWDEPDYCSLDDKDIAKLKQGILP